MTHPTSGMQPRPIAPLGRLLPPAATVVRLVAVGAVTLAAAAALGVALRGGVVPAPLPRGGPPVPTCTATASTVRAAPLAPTTTTSATTAAAVTPVTVAARPPLFTADTSDAVAAAAPPSRQQQPQQQPQLQQRRRRRRQRQQQKTASLHPSSSSTSWRQSPLGRAEDTTSAILLILSYLLLPSTGVVLVWQLRAPPPDTLVFAGSLLGPGGRHASTSSAIAAWLAATAGGAVAAACPRRRAVAAVVAAATVTRVWGAGDQVGRSGSGRGCDASTSGDGQPHTTPPPTPECAVCLANLVAGEEALTVRSCGHVFHSACGVAWLVDGRNNCCPLCRGVVCEGLDVDYRPVGGAEGGKGVCR